MEAIHSSNPGIREIEYKSLSNNPFLRHGELKTINMYAIIHSLGSNQPASFIQTCIIRSDRN